MSFSFSETDFKPENAAESGRYGVWGVGEGVLIPLPLCGKLPNYTVRIKYDYNFCATNVKFMYIVEFKLVRNYPEL